jgi:hypothetical protein
MTQYELAEEQEPNKIVFHAGNAFEEPILKISKDGFWVRGVQVPQGPGEAEAVYKAFQQWMTYCALTRQY